MCRRDDCWDNARGVLLPTLKTRIVMHCEYQTRDDARISLFGLHEVFSNRQRRHSSIDYEAPLPFEAMQSRAGVPPFVGKIRSGHHSVCHRRDGPNSLGYSIALLARKHYRGGNRHGQVSSHFQIYTSSTSDDCSKGSSAALAPLRILAHSHWRAQSYRSRLFRMR
jgi:hypothetical protein